jgi:hypothetical protein
MIYSVAMSSAIQSQLANHLLRLDGQEDLCFALWYPSQGRDRFSGLLHTVILPENGDRIVRGNATFLPQYYERAVRAAVAQGSGLAFLHSHLGPGWQGMSRDDVKAEQRHAASTKGATGLPLLGLTMATDGAWSARFWQKIAPRSYDCCWCVSVRVVGDDLGITFDDKVLPPPKPGRELTRTVSAWGPKAQAQLSRLRIGVVGVGSVGCIVAESLARMGVSSIRLLDFDNVEDINLDRLLHAARSDVMKPKVRTVATALRRAATAPQFVVEPLQCSVAEEVGFRAVLDCDIVFSCVDRPWPRQVLNFIAYAHLIPVVDGGVAVTTKKGNTGLHRADVRAHIAAPGRRCLECLRQYDSGLVSAEREGMFDDPAYIAGLPDDHPIRRKENVFAFGLSAASFEVLQMLSMVIAPLGVFNIGAQMYHCVPGILDRETEGSCNPTCPIPGLEAKGDRSGVTLTGRHQVAEECRNRQTGFRGLVRRFHWWLQGAFAKL